MATIALAASGATFGGPIGLALATSAASYIDSTFIFPALFPQDPIEGPKLSDLQIQATEEGAPILRCFGAENRVPGTVIWTSGLKENAKTEEVGGKGGGGVEQTTYTYSVDCAVDFGEGPPDGLGIVEFTRIYANTKTIYKEHPEINISDTTLTAIAGTQFLYGNIVSNHRLQIKSPNGGPDLSQFRSGVDIVVAGFDESVDNGTFRCTRAWKDNGTGESFVEVKDKVISFVDDANAGANTITLDQTPPKFNKKEIAAVTLYKGTETQTANSLIQGLEDNVPAFRRVAYVLLDDLQLANYGNALPNFNGQVWATGTTDYTGGDPETVGGAIQKLLTLAKEDKHRFAGLTAITFDTTAVDAIPLRGFVVRGPQPLRSILQPLMLAFDIAARETNGTITFFLRKNAATIPVTLDDLAAHPFGGDARRPFTVKERQGQAFPKEYVVRYLEPDKHYQQGAQRAKRLDVATGGAASTELPIVMTATQAKDIAERLLWTPYANRREVILQLPPSYFTVQEGDALTFTDGLGKPWRVLVQQVDRGANHLVRIEGIEEVSALLSFTSITDPPKPPENDDEVYIPGEVELALIDECALRDQDVNQPGIYIAVGLLDTAVSWAGADWFESSDDTTYTHLTPASDEASLGTVDTVLGDVVDPDLVDEANTLRVTVRDAVLQSRAGDDVLAGANRIAVGTIRSEIVGWEISTLISTNADGSRTYDLTILHRGLAGTEGNTGGHVANEQVVVLSSSGVQFLPISQAQINTTRFYKPVAASGLETDYEADSLLQAARCVQPMTVAHLTAERNVPSTNDWSLAWDRRTRLNIDVLANDEIPLEEETEEYEIETRVVATGAAISTYTSTSPSFTLTAAQQTTDYGSPQATIRVAVFQMSAVVGRGKEIDQTFTG